MLVEDDPARALGPALAWALRNGATSLHVLAGDATGLLARRAAGLRFPIDVWHVDDRTLLPAVRRAARSRRPHRRRPTSRWLDTIVAGGAVPVVEHGVVTGEVRGLEVCRVVDDPHTGAVRLEVGVGAHDREAFTIMHGDVPTVEALAGVVRAVDEHRRPGAVLAPAEPPGARAPPALAARAGPRRCSGWPPSRPSSRRCRARTSRTACRASPTAGATTARRWSSCARSASTSTSSRTRSTPGSQLGSVRPGVGGEVWLVAPARDLVPVTAEIAALADQALSLVPFSG